VQCTERTTRSMPAPVCADARDQREHLFGRRVADRVWNVDRRRTGLDRGAKTSHRNESSERVASSALNSTSRQSTAACETAVRPTPALVRPIRSLCSRWMSDVARNVWMRGLSATGWLPKPGRCLSPSHARARRRWGPSARTRARRLRDRAHASSRRARRRGIPPRLRRRRASRALAPLRASRSWSSTRPAIAHRREESCRRCERTRALLVHGGLHGSLNLPGAILTGSKNGMFSRSAAPTCSMGSSRSARRNLSSCPRPCSFSSIQRFAN